MKYTIDNHKHIYCNDETNRPWCDLCGLMKSTIESQKSTDNPNIIAVLEITETDVTIAFITLKGEKVITRIPKEELRKLLEEINK